MQWRRCLGAFAFATLIGTGLYATSLDTEAPSPSAPPDASPTASPADKPEIDPALQMYILVNRERVKLDLAPYEFDKELSVIAKQHSADMIEHKYFEHTSPTEGTAQDRIFKAGIACGGSGENIATNMTVERAHIALMKSPGHRANILSTYYDHIGIGIEKHPDGSLMVTQDFCKAVPVLSAKVARKDMLGALNEKRTAAGLPKLRPIAELMRVASYVAKRQDKEQSLMAREPGALIEQQHLKLATYTAWVALEPDFQAAAGLADVTNPTYNAVGLAAITNKTQEKGLGMMWMVVVLAQVPEHPATAGN